MDRDRAPAPDSDPAPALDRDLPLGLLLGLAYEQVVTELHEHLAGEGFGTLKPAFGYAFKLIAAAESLTIRELATKLEITHQGAAKLADEMVQSGYVDRAPDPTDARAKRLTLTDRSRALMASGHAFQSRFEQQLTTALGQPASDAAREALTWILNRTDKPEGLARTLRPLT